MLAVISYVLLCGLLLYAGAEILFSVSYPPAEKGQDEIEVRVITGELVVRRGGC